MLPLRRASQLSLVNWLSLVLPRRKAAGSPEHFGWQFRYVERSGRAVAKRLAGGFFGAALRSTAPRSQQRVPPGMAPACRLGDYLFLWRSSTSVSLPHCQTPPAARLWVPSAILQSSPCRWRARLARLHEAVRKDFVTARAPKTRAPGQPPRPVERRARLSETPSRPQLANCPRLTRSESRCGSASRSAIVRAHAAGTSHAAPLRTLPRTIRLHATTNFWHGVPQSSRHSR
jgi:hypothetical protein